MSVVERYNPYVLRIRDFPERIFCFDDFETERKQIQETVKDAKRCFCEIGSGSGKHLITLGAQYPQGIFFGIELRYKRAVRTIEKAELQGVDNVYVLHIDAKAIRECFPPQSLDGIYIHFPDPWEKKRHRKHRLLSIDYFEDLFPLLKQNGFVSVKTDHRDYFTTFLRERAQSQNFDIEEITEDLYLSEFFSANIGSEFEALFVSRKLPICYAKLVKRDG